MGIHGALDVSSKNCCSPSMISSNLRTNEKVVASLVYQDVRSMLLTPPEKIATMKGAFNEYDFPLKKSPRKQKKLKKQKPPKGNKQTPAIKQPPFSPPPVVLDDRTRGDYNDQIERLQKQLEAIESKKAKELTSIRARKKEEKKKLKAEVKAATAATREQEESSGFDELQSNRATIMQLRIENDKIRARNQEMRNNVSNLRTNNERLGDTTKSLTCGYYASLKTHHQRLDSDNKKLRAAANKSKVKVDELQREVDEVTEKIKYDRFAVECYQRTISVALELLNLSDNIDVLREVRGILQETGMADEAFAKHCLVTCASPRKKKSAAVTRKQTTHKSKIPSLEDDSEDSDSSDNTGDY